MSRIDDLAAISCTHVWTWEPTENYDDTDLICKKCGEKKDLDGPIIAIGHEFPNQWRDNDEPS